MKIHTLFFGQFTCLFFLFCFYRTLKLYKNRVVIHNRRIFDVFNQTDLKQKSNNFMKFLVFNCEINYFFTV